MRAATTITVLAALAAGLGCRQPATTTPKFIGDVRHLDGDRVDPAYQEDFDALASARRDDPAGAPVLEIADRLLAREPPIPVQLAALAAKAEHAYLGGDDAVAIAHADRGLALVQIPADRPAAVLLDLAKTRARALARGGDPAAALVALSDPLLGAPDRLTPDEALGLSAVAHDRNAEPALAIAGYARWREILTDDDPTAAWVEHRIAAIAPTLDPDAWSVALHDVPASAARACLLANKDGARANATDDVPAWARRCGAVAGGIGLLLPRTGPLSALSDVQLAAAVAAVDVLTPGTALAFRDSGSNKAEARAAAEALLAEGVRVIVGPVGAANVAAVTDVVGSRALLVVPGEAKGSAIGVAPSLERRVKRLIDHALSAKKKRMVVLAPDNDYGKRVAAAVTKHGGVLAKATVIKHYPSGTTSFKPVLDPLMTALTEDAAVIVADHLPRAEMLVRQLLRSGKMPARGSASGMMMMTTAEAADPKVVAAAPDVFEGVWASPVAAAGPDADAFAIAYQARQGVAPDDQALLVFYAMRRALSGAPSPDPGPAPLVRFIGGRFVVQATAAR